MFLDGPLLSCYDSCWAPVGGLSISHLLLQLPIGSISGLYCKHPCLYIQPCINFIDEATLIDSFTWPAHAYTDFNAPCIQCIAYCVELTRTSTSIGIPKVEFAQNHPQIKHIYMCELLSLGFPLFIEIEMAKKERQDPGLNPRPRALLE